ncbi:NAD(P)H-hydrate dehydratase [Ramlibacter algicola]|uniref:Bifunctional NAD(P)H-hydrate repair enzyme n=1 Tax=Ramlibacter algicola TaxID=2795217 RepID=A0A934Q3M2_9BURK|nr:NAD(P)H-hydrate dehydratase [Ramlibacter algicola]MBK0393627.1 NAD(P)H-hydrate dehydratase [Ramlibacter algicola]
MRKVTPDRSWPLHDVAALRAIEGAASSSLPPHTLMDRAGLATARLALAIAPHARTVWIACGPGNNGGDGFEAAMHLHRAGKHVVPTLCGARETLPQDAAISLAKCEAAGLAIAEMPPVQWDLCIDALLGIGSNRAPEGALAHTIARINSAEATVLAVDVPSGLGADTGHAALCVRAHHTATFLALKPGLFTAQGRDAAGQVWLDDLGIEASVVPIATLGGPPTRTGRLHASHKGSYGDVAVVGGAPGMPGAAVLAAQAALHAGAGRVYFAPLDADASRLVAGLPELMWRGPRLLPLQDLTIACGCGGGEAIGEVLETVVREARALVLDADALNLLAQRADGRELVLARGERPTVLTPHPLEAARLLGVATTEVQADRLRSARQLAGQFGCTVVLKGSGTVVAAPGRTPCINPTGNARLATGGTGDVLAGLLAARLAQGMPAFDAACAAVHEHGAVADQWPAHESFTAGGLARRLRA